MEKKKINGEIFGVLEKEEYNDLLDCGCGTGPMISLLYEKNPQKHYTGLDLTPKMIEVGKSKNLKGMDCIIIRTHSDFLTV